MKYLIFLVLISSTGVLTAQQTEFKKLSFSGFIGLYNSLLEKQPTELYSLDIVTEIFRDKTDKQSMSLTKGTLTKGKGLEQSYVSGNQVFIQNDSIRLIADTTEKQVVITYPGKEGIGTVSMDYLKKADSTKYEFYTRKSKLVTEFKIVETVRVSSNKELILVFNNETKQLNAVGMYYWESNYFSSDLNDETVEQPMMKMTYTNYKTLPENSPVISELLGNWLIKTTASTYKLNSKVQGYTLEDLRNKNSKL